MELPQPDKYDLYDENGQKVKTDTMNNLVGYLKRLKIGLESLDWGRIKDDLSLTMVRKSTVSGYVVKKIKK